MQRPNLSVLAARGAALSSGNCDLLVDAVMKSNVRLDHREEAQQGNASGDLSAANRRKLQDDCQQCIIGHRARHAPEAWGAGFGDVPGRGVAG